MNKKQDKISQRDFIKEKILLNVPKTEIERIFVDKYGGLSSRTFHRRYLECEDELRHRLKDIDIRVNKLIEKELESRKHNVMSVIERKLILSEIARGNLTVKQTMFSSMGDIVEVDVAPTFSDRKNAIAELNKMGGDYAPQKVDLTLMKIGKEAEEYINGEVR